MTDLQVFKNDLFKGLRGGLIDDVVWFVGKDVAENLGYSNASKAVSTHCKHIRKEIIDVSSQNGKAHKARKTQEMSLINEGDLYRLIIKSKLPAAQEFEEWVMDEVLPTIRKTGGYINKNATPVQLKKLKNNIIELEEKNAKLEYKIATTLIDTKKVSLLGSTINYRAGLAGPDKADLVKKAMVRELRHKFNISAYGDLQEYQFNDAMNFINHYPVTPDNTKVTILANLGK